MVNESESPIFYDPTKHRWQFYRVFVAIVSLVMTIAFLAALFGVARQEKLPELPLMKPSPMYRNRPASVQATPNPQTTPVNPNPTFSLPAPLTASAQNPNNNSQIQKPKLIGFYVNWDDTSLTSLKANYNDLDELAPEWMHLADVEGGIVLDDPARQEETLEFLAEKRPDLPIVPLINNYDSETQSWDGERLKLMLANPESRSRNIKEILNYVQKNNSAGVCIDYESIPAESYPHYGQFMKELYDTFHPLGLSVSLAAPLDDNSFDLKSLVNSADYFILMAYDEHWPGSMPGPIASQQWYLNSLKQRFSEIPAEKIIIALGNYGYDWKEGQSQADNYTFQDSMRVARESEGKIVLDPVSLNETFDYYDENGIYHRVYLLDAVTVFNQVAPINNIPVSGYALWRLGSEDPSIWPVLRSRQNSSREVAESIKSLKYGYDIDYEGKGEILKVVGSPKEGHRTLTYDDNSRLITEAEVTDFASPFVITRWGASDSKKIALTFDDGPDPVYTPEILKILNQYNAKATFFIVGVNGTQNQWVLRNMFQSGHEIGSHTFTHPNIATVSAPEFKFELNSVESLLASTIGRYTLLFRPPYAEDVEPATPDQVSPLVSVNNLGYYTVGMHVDPKDWSRPGAGNIASSVIDDVSAGNGNVVLLHDSGGERSQTVAALPVIIEKLQKNGYQFVTVSELIGVSRDSVMPAVAGREKIVSDGSFVAFTIVNWTLYLLQLAFGAGIFLGVARFLFIATLAVEQKIRKRSVKFLSVVNYHPSVSVVIPAFNEEKVIVKTVRSILRSDYPYFDIIVVDDGSKDRTYDFVKREFAGDPKVKILTKTNGGKSSALNCGIRNTKAEIVITLDADTMFLPDTISNLARHFANRRVGAVAGNAKVGNRLNLLTFWQALEYITSQNLDRRAFHILNCITVVPGSVGAWRRSAVIKAGGFSGRTLAEDADLTFYIIRLGYKVAYEDEALGLTEAPDTVRSFIKQRFRWMYGTLQTAWKHKEAINCRGCRALGIIGIPNIIVFQVIFPLISPFMDLTIFASLLWVLWQRYHHPLDYSAGHAFEQLLIFYLFFLVVDFFTSAIAFALERKEDWSLLFWMFLQRFFYRQLMYYVAIKVTLSAIKGKMVRWGKLERKATVAA